MTASSHRVPLTARPKDLAMFVYFLVHIPATVLMDVVPLYPSFIQALIKPLMDLQVWYVENLRDPLMADRELIWFNTFLHMEALIQLPIFIYAAWALYNNKRSVALLICVYAAHVITTVIPCLTTVALGKSTDFPFDVSSNQRTILLSMYSPWFFFPLWMLVECFGRVRSYEQAGISSKKTK
ncbi:hypothetical protein BG006_009905 [Podila minutissima]|uniref:Efficient mitochondria targeting-associated protein 19 n=1 Tax=Podila minutissima TaxID=64525 RepID=A0A9P5VIK5_9FUNG|nr:hypothetical protein BG006_009905 [Podila minutissima]